MTDHVEPSGAPECENDGAVGLMGPENLPPTPRTTASSSDSSNVVAQNQTVESDKKRKKKKPPPEIEVNPLDPQQMFDRIPKDGIGVYELAEALGVDETNYRLFTRWLKVMSTSTDRGWISPVPERPAECILNEILKEEKSIPVRPKLKKNESYHSELEGDVILTWKNADDMILNTKRMIPKKVYRVFYEDSATLSTFMSKYNHVKRRLRPSLQLDRKNAFQAIAKFQGKRDLTPQRIERHFVWNMRKEESAYISFFNTLHDAERRLRFHSRGGASERVGDRVALAEVDTSELRGAHVHAEMRTYVITSGNRTLMGHKSHVKTTNVQIPIFVHKDALRGHEHDDHITLKQLEDSGTDFWLSTTALRRSDLHINTARSHDYEWLCCGAIKKSRISRVMPFTAGKLHYEPGEHEVRSEQGEKCWVWSWKRSRWIRDAAREQQRKTLNEEESEDEEVVEFDSHDEGRNNQSPARKRKVSIEDSGFRLDDRRIKKLRVQDRQHVGHCTGACGTCLERKNNDHRSTIYALDLALSGEHRISKAV